MNIDHLRSLFPVTEEAIYFNNASQGPLNTLVYDKLQSLLQAELNPVGKKGFNRDTTKTLLAKLLGGSPEEYALVTSTGIGIGMVAQGVDFKKGDNVVLPEKEHWNNIFPWLALESKGVEIRFAKLDAENRVVPGEIEKLVDDRTRVVAIAAVRYNSGFRPDLVAIGKIAHQKGALFMVDVAQAAGMIPIEVEEAQIDIMSGCGFKWLLGMHGTGFLYVSKRVIERVNPTLPGMFAADHDYNKLSYHADARKFETGTIAYPLFGAWNAGLELLVEIGIENIYQKALDNTDLLNDGIKQNGYQLITPITNRAERTAIVHFNAGSEKNTQELYEELTNKRALVTLQGKNIRVSPNFFNTTTEIDQFISLI